MNITFSLLLINLNSCMWLVAAVLASAVLDHLRYLVFLYTLPAKRAAMLFIVSIELEEM